MTLKPHQWTKKKSHAKLNKRCHTYFIASSIFLFFQLSLKSLGRYDCLSSVWPSTTDTAICLQHRGLSLSEEPPGGKQKCNKRHSSLKRQRTEAPWNFTKNPLGVTKALTIPWEFINNNKKNPGQKKNRLNAPLEPRHTFPTVFRLITAQNEFI